MFVLIMGVIGSKSRSPGQILVKFSLHSFSYIFGLSTVTQVSDAGPSWPSCLFLIFHSLFDCIVIFRIFCCHIFFLYEMPIISFLLFSSFLLLSLLFFYFSFYFFICFVF